MVNVAREALVNISESGVVNYTALADMMNITPDYARLICRSLTKFEFIEVDPAGDCKITQKGKYFLNENNAES